MGIMNCNFLICLASVSTLSFATNSKAQNAAPFELKIERFERRAVMPRDVAAGYDMQLAVILNYVGTAPKWWERHSRDSSALSGKAKLFYEADEQARPVLSKPDYRNEVQNWTPDWNPETQRYEVRYLLHLSEVARSKERIVLRDKISFSDFNGSPIKSGSPQNSTVAFSYGVRASEGVVAAPEVNRDPKIDLIRVEIEKFDRPQTDGLDDNKYDTVVRFSFHDRNAAAPHIGSSGYPVLVDEKGEPIPTEYNWSPSVVVENFGKTDMSYSDRFVLSAIPQSQPNIFIDTQLSLHGDWPIRLHIPLRRNGHDLSGELSQSQYTATPAQRH